MRTGKLQQGQLAEEPAIFQGAPMEDLDYKERESLVMDIHRDDPLPVHAGIVMSFAWAHRIIIAMMRHHDGPSFSAAEAKQHEEAAKATKAYAEAAAESRSRSRGSKSGFSNGQAWQKKHKQQEQKKKQQVQKQ